MSGAAEVSVQIVTPLFAYMNTVVKGFVSNNVSQVITYITPAVAAGMTCTLTFEGAMSLLKPGGGEPLSDLLSKFARWGVILSFATAGGLYQGTIVDMIQNLPDDFANTLVLSDSTGKSASGMASVLDTVLSQGLTSTKTAFTNAGVMSGAGLSALFEAACLAIMTAIVVGIGASFLLFSKTMLAICIVLGPMAIMCLLWGATTPLFGRWLSSTTNYGLITVLVACVFGLVNHFFKVALDKAAQASDSLLVPTITCGLLTVLIIYIMKQIPELASKLSDGITLSAPRIFGAGAGAAAGGAVGAQQGMAASQGKGGIASAASVAAGAIKGAMTGGVAGAAGGAAAGMSKGLARGSRG